MNKKIILLFLTVSILSYADGMYIAPNQLPSSILQFIKTYFQNTAIIYAEMDRKTYEIALDNGVEIEFFRNGDLKEIEGNYTALPSNILPKSVANTVTKTYPNTVITKIKKKWNIYEVKLNNMMELYIDANNGQLLGQKFDD
ncbi:PepSY-like domain-containing protein [Brachyspira innocens]|uniref:PepSY-like domain-containing protein n=1 Tax=Brachyspira innocens TaxID=13264 RepID=A0ABT8YZS7_9SPIR|nr:PepSY-like domain-containing protein [Brachyspira innocens]MDO6994923.1 PepSY-like domain-containing protein [Brachyspira innocens]MDO7021384.1 PepSY-like domain-containing protein [Brachyspira innocens]